MPKRFRSWSPDQQSLFPTSPRDWLNEDHLVYFLLDVVGQMDLSPFLERYKNSPCGQPPYHPRMMLTLLLYAYCTGVFSSRKIYKRCQEDVAFRVIVGEDIPDFRTISDFRKDNLEHMQALFVDVLSVCAETGLLKLGRIALDGSKIKANASRHKAMSYGRMQEKEEQLQNEIEELLARAQARDDEEDQQFGNHRGDELPDELARRESRLKKIKEARAALEEQAKQKAQEHVDRMEAEGRQPRTDPDKAVPQESDQRNFTDPDSKIMKMSNKGFDQCGNAQIIVEENQIILSADVTNQANDVKQVEPVLKQMESNLAAADVEEKPQEFLADAGYYSDSNVEFVQAHDLAPFIATGKFKHGESVPESPQGRIPKHLSAKERMGRKLRTKKGRATYSRRKVQVEPVFGQIKACQGFRQFLLRGLEKMQGEWTLVSLTHNLLKLFRFQTA